MRVRVPVVIVEDEDGEDHAGRHHPLDEVEICACTSVRVSESQFAHEISVLFSTYQGHGVACDGHQLRHDVHEDGE